MHHRNPVLLHLAAAIVATAIVITSTPALAGGIAISTPTRSDTRWDGAVEGTGCQQGHRVHVYIRTDTDYLQGEVSCGSGDRWQLARTHPTDGAVNDVFAVLVDGNGREAARSSSIAVDLRGSLDDVRYSVQIDDLTKGLSPDDLVNYFIRGVYIRCRITVQLESGPDDRIASVHAYVEAEDGKPGAPVLPAFNTRTYDLRHDGRGGYSIEVEVLSMGQVVSSLLGLCGPQGSSFGLPPGILTTSPGMNLETITLVGANGERVERRVNRALPIYFAGIDPALLDQRLQIESM